MASILMILLHVLVRCDSGSAILVRPVTDAAAVGVNVYLPGGAGEVCCFAPIPVSERSSFGAFDPVGWASGTASGLYITSLQHFSESLLARPMRTQPNHNGYHREIAWLSKSQE